MDVYLTRPFLDTLSTGELMTLADSLGIDVPPATERIFIIDEILEADNGDEEAGQEDEEERPELLGETELLEPVSLPKQYNITYLDVYVRDPLWVFAFWEIKGQDKEKYERDPDFEGYCLKVCPLKGSPGNTGVLNLPGEDNSFTVPVGVSDFAWYLGFPPGGGFFRVELCVLRGGKAVTLAVSRPFKLPDLLPAEGADAGESPLGILSGFNDLPVLRNGDRQSRTLRTCGKEG
jgi:hypothetical protein